MFNLTNDGVARPQGCRPFMNMTQEKARATRPANFSHSSEQFNYDCCEDGSVVAADGVIEILDTIGGWGVYSTEVIPVLRQMDGEGKIIVIRINSYGGDVFEGIAIANTIADLKARVIVEVIGVAASIASVIAIAADEVKIRKSAQMMIHKPWSITWGEADDLRASADHLDLIQVQLEELYTDRSNGKKSAQEINAAVNKGTWLSAKQSVEWGFADTVVEKDKVEAKVENAVLEEMGIKNIVDALKAEENSEAPVSEEAPIEPAVEPTAPAADVEPAPVQEEQKPVAPVYDDAQKAAIFAAFNKTKNPSAAAKAMEDGLTVEQAKAQAFDMLAEEDEANSIKITNGGSMNTLPLETAEESIEQKMARIRANQIAEFNAKTFTQTARR